MPKLFASSLLGVIFAIGCTSEQPASFLQARIDKSGQIAGLREVGLTIEQADEAELGGGMLAATTDGALVGAPGSVEGHNRGAAIPFTRTETDWTVEAALSPPELIDGARFGSSMAASGRNAAIGAPFTDSGSGVVWLYERVNGAWQPAPSPVTPPNPEVVEPEFGRSLALTSDLFVVGTSISQTDGQLVYAAYVAERSGAAWGPFQRLVGDPSLTADAQFGFTVAAYGDTVVVGAPWASPAGAVYIFERADWSVATAIVGDIDAGALPGSAFGGALALDATHLFVGAPGENSATGSVYAFRRAKGGPWQPGPTLVSKVGSVPDAEPGDQFGTSLGLALGRLFVGSPATELTRMRAQAFSVEPPNDEEARFAPEIETGFIDFGRTLSTTESSVVVGSIYGARAYVLELGAACTQAEHCSSGHCVDGVCCATSCEGACSACSAPLKASGVSGECGPMRAGTTGECETGPGECGQTGVCDGQGSCALVETGERCGSASCEKKTQSREAGKCNGAGACERPPARECEVGYVCDAGSCAISCSPDGSGCGNGYYCFDRSCVSGPRCSADRLIAYDPKGRSTKCDIEFCRDGVCPDQCEVDENCLSGHCDSTRHACVQSCTGADASCNEGYYCFSGACVPGPGCSKDRLTAYDAQGNATTCANVLCREGVCPPLCEVTEDCIAGLCDPTSHQCGDPAEIAPSGKRASPQTSCSYGVSAPGSEPVWLLAIAAFCVRRRRGLRNPPPPIRTS